MTKLFCDWCKKEIIFRNEDDKKVRNFVNLYDAFEELKQGEPRFSVDLCIPCSKKFKTECEKK